jgi:inner membrane protein
MQVIYLSRSSAPETRLNPDVDNLTHSLFALTLARTPLGRLSRGAPAALVIASNIPDIDIVTTAGGAVSYMQWHRGPTHGWMGVLGLGILTAAIVWLAARRREPPRDVPPTSFRLLVMVSMVGVVLHILMDLPTSYGTRLLSPIDWHWFAVDWLPIIDIYLLVILIAALVFGRASPEARRRNAAIALVLMAANYGLRGAAHHRAMTLAPQVFGPALPPACGALPSSVLEVWPRAAPTGFQNPAGKRCLVELAAMPTFISPFKWRVIAHLSNAYELHDVDLLDGRFLDPARGLPGAWRTTVRLPNVWTPIVDTAARARTAQLFLGFSRFPAVRWVTAPDGVTTVRWRDVRFAGGLFRLDQAVERSTPFAAMVRVGADGDIVEEKIAR